MLQFVTQDLYYIEGLSLSLCYWANISLILSYRVKIVLSRVMIMVSLITSSGTLPQRAD